jgi:short-subunit dehydrogenase
MKNKHNNVVIIGASQGIGKALAMEYASHNAKLVLLSRNTASIENIANDITANGGECYVKK